METVLPKNNEVDRERALRRVIGYLTGLPLNRAFKVTTVEKKPTRSVQQNAYLWGVCYAALMKVLPGWDADDVHEYMLGEWSGWELIEGMGRKRLRPVKRSSALNKQDFADFIAFVQRKAAQHGVVIADAQLDPDE